MRFSGQDRSAGCGVWQGFYYSLLESNKRRTGTLPCPVLMRGLKPRRYLVCFFATRCISPFWLGTSALCSAWLDGLLATAEPSAELGCSRSAVSSLFRDFHEPLSQHSTQTPLPNGTSLLWQILTLRQSPWDATGHTTSSSAGLFATVFDSIRELVPGMTGRQRDFVSAISSAYIRPVILFEMPIHD